MVLLRPSHTVLVLDASTNYYGGVDDCVASMLHQFCLLPSTRNVPKPGTHAHTNFLGLLQPHHLMHHINVTVKINTIRRECTNMAATTSSVRPEVIRELNENDVLLGRGK